MSNFGKGVPALYRKLHRAGVEALSLIEYEGGRHEILNDRCRDEVTADLLEWLAQYSDAGSANARNASVSTA